MSLFCLQKVYIIPSRQQDGNSVILSGAGAYGDDEAILKWVREENTVRFV